jgi:hypothetical protein
MLTSSLKTKVAKLENELCSQHKLARRWSLWLTSKPPKKVSVHGQSGKVCVHGLTKTTTMDFADLEYWIIYWTCVLTVMGLTT